MWQVDTYNMQQWTLNIHTIIEENIQYHHPILCDTCMETINLFAGGL